MNEFEPPAAAPSAPSRSERGVSGTGARRLVFTVPGGRIEFFSRRASVVGVSCCRRHQCPVTR